MSERYAVAQDVPPEMVDNSEAPIRWRLIEPIRAAVEEMTDRAAPTGYVLEGRDLQRLQMDDPDTGEWFYVFRHRSIYVKGGTMSQDHRIGGLRGERRYTTNG